MNKKVDEGRKKKGVEMKRENGSFYIVDYFYFKPFFMLMNRHLNDLIVFEKGGEGRVVKKIKEKKFKRTFNHFNWFCIRHEFYG